MSLKKEPKKTRSGSDLYANYELSWLSFNRRVLAEAQNPEAPLLERVNFIGIVCSNLDEFYQKRVGGLKRQVHAGVSELSVDGRTPLEQLKEIRKEVEKMIEAYRSCYFDDLVPALEKEGLIIRLYTELDKKCKKKADSYFEDQLYPIITPLAVDEARPFPFISNKSRSFAIKLYDPKTEEELFARIKIPSNRPRWIQVKKSKKEIVLVSVSDIIREKAARFFPGMEIRSMHIFRVTRNADIERNEQEADDLLEMIEEELRERRFADIVRAEIDAEMPEDVKDYLIKHLKLDRMDVFEMVGPIGLADCTQLNKISGFQELRYDHWTPMLHPVFRHEVDEEFPDFFQELRRNDILVHHPYHSFESSTQRFVEKAADDPKVLAIKQTLYRTSSDSPAMHALMRAANEGKQVAVLVELKARFDEERNINWAQKLEKAGVHVSYGLAGLKIHTKLTMVVREEEDGLRRYIHIGTGNYHPDTAQLYEDLGLFTTDSAIGADVTDLFNLLTGYAPDQSYKKLLVAPKHLRNQINRLIDAETENAKKGEPARIIAKMNSLEDPKIIQRLYRASEAGVQIDLIVRGVCRLLPMKKEISENIRVHAIIGRFLEHSRCYYFCAGGKEKYFIGSADWMQRNLDARVEVLCPIENRGLKEYFAFMFDLYLKDNQQRWLMQPDGKYKRIKPKKGEDIISVHKKLMAHTRSGDNPVPKALPAP